MNDELIYKTVAKVEQHDEELKETKAEIKELKEKTSLLTELSLSIKALAENLNDVKETVTDIKNEQGDMKNEISDLKQLPAKQKSQILDKVVLAVIAAIGGGILTFILKAVFPTIFA